MYSTVTEMHIALDMGLQHINSNRKQSISVDHKDMALNYAVLQYVETRTNPKTNIKKEGLEETQKRYDDLEDLKRSATLTCYKDSSRVFTPLPKDYYKLISAGGLVTFSRFVRHTADQSKSFNTHILTFPTSASDIEYSNFKIFKKPTTTSDGSIGIQVDSIVFDASEYPNLPLLYREDSKFMLINLILEELNKREDLEVYWEKWNGHYVKNSLLIIDSSKVGYTMSYSDTIVYSILKPNQFNHYKELTGRVYPIDLFSSRHEFEALVNPYYDRNSHLNPKGVIENGRFMLLEGQSFSISKCTIVYYKKPRLISFRHNQTCEITINREIIDLAVQRLKAYVKDEGYQHIVNESQIVE